MSKEAEKLVEEMERECGPCPYWDNLGKDCTRHPYEDMPPDALCEQKRKSESLAVSLVVSAISLYVSPAEGEALEKRTNEIIKEGAEPADALKQAMNERTSKQGKTEKDKK